jgi:hypothetical protein
MRPSKRTGFGHGVYEQSKAKKEVVGTYRATQDNRGFRYILAGAANLDVAKATSSVAEDADLVDEDVTVAGAIGDSQIVFYPGGSTTLTVDELEGGYYSVNDATGEGQMRRIAGNTAVASQANFTITLDEPLKVATVVTTTQHTIIHNPWSKVVKQATATIFPTGVPQVAITLAQYGWSQTKGWGTAWHQEATTPGEELIHGGTDGQLILNAAYVSQIVGWMGPATPGVAEYQPVYFVID